LVLTTTASRPMRTSCENVGTVAPLFYPRFRSRRNPFQNQKKNRQRAQLRQLSQGARKKSARERTPTLKGATANPEKLTSKNSVRRPKGRTILLLTSMRRGLLGFAGLAPHSGRSSVPFHPALFRDGRSSLPTRQPRKHTTRISGCPNDRGRTPLTNNRV